MSNGTRSSARAQTIQIYLPLGDPSGIRVATLSTRTVRLFEVPRPLLPAFLAMPESQQVAVYYLIGDSEDDEPLAYIGQTGEIGRRLKQHARGKEFWTRALVAISLTNEWTSTHVAFLEWQSIQKASSAKRYPLTNGVGATKPFTPPPLEADCFEFLDTISMLLATLGVPLLEEFRRTRPPVIDSTSTEDSEFFFRDSGCAGVGVQTSDGFLVREGSRGRAVLRPSAESSLAGRRKALQSEGVIRVEGDEVLFLSDHIFSSPSSAGQILVGGSVNGRTAWKTASGKTLKEVEQDEIESVLSASDSVDEDESRERS